MPSSRKSAEIKRDARIQSLSSSVAVSNKLSSSLPVASQRVLLGNLLPVILGGDIGAYSLARAFHEAYGIKALVLSQKSSRLCGDSVILHNRAVSSIEEEESLLAELSAVSERNPNKRFLLLACGDWYVRIISEHKKELEAQRYLIPYVDAALLDQLVLKDRFYELCEQTGVPYPRTVIYDCQNPPARLEVPFEFPVVAKPASSAAYHYAQFPGKRKVFFPNTMEELEGVLAAAQGGGYRHKFLIQELIPGDDTGMRILTCYCDRNSDVRMAAFGQTILEEKGVMGIGNPVAIVSRVDERIIQEAARLLKSVGYTGFANFDIKIDPRTGGHVFFEINTRLGRSNYYVTAAGSNVAEWLVRDLVLGEDLGDGIEVAKGPSLYTVVPKGTLLDYVESPQLKAEIRMLYAQGYVANPVSYSAEKRLVRRLYPLVRAAKQRRAFRKALGR